MKITTISQNVQGLNDSSKVDIIRNYYRTLLLETDVICFQEHKLWGDKLQAAHIMWNGARFFGIEAQIAYNHNQGDARAESGGIGMWVAPQLVPPIHVEGQSRAGNAQWICFKGVPGGDIGILNVYAPHKSPERCVLWLELIDNLPRNCKWIMIGNWNFVERGRDKSNDRASITSEE